MKEKISPPLDLAVVSAGGWGPLIMGMCQKACPFFFYILWVPVNPPQGRSTVMQVLEMSP